MVQKVGCQGSFLTQRNDKFESKRVWCQKTNPKSILKWEKRVYKKQASEESRAQHKCLDNVQIQTSQNCRPRPTATDSGKTVGSCCGEFVRIKD